MKSINKKLCDRIRTDRKTRGRALPLICYALDSNIIGEDEYESLKDIVVNEQSSVNVGTLLIFIRNFFERTVGIDIWKSSPNVSMPVLNQQMRRSYPQIFGEWNMKPKDWTASQCWIIKRNGSSRLIKNNRYIFKLLSDCAIFNLSRPWQEISEDDFELLELDSEAQDELQSLLESNVYLKYIWENYRQEYLLSLRAIVSSKNEVNEVEGWLKTLVGMAPSSVKINYEWKLLSRRDKSLSPALVLSSEFRGAKIRQGELEVSSSSGVFHLWYLIDNGFDLFKDIQIIAEDGEVAPAISSPFVKGGMLFRTRRNKEILLEDSVIGGGSFYLFYLREYNDPQVSINHVSVNGNAIDNVPRQLKCLEYRIPYLPQQQVKNIHINNEDTKVRVNTRPRIVLCNPCDVTVVGEANTFAVDSDEIRFYAYGLTDVFVNDEMCREVEEGSCYYCVKLGPNCGQLLIKGRSIADNKIQWLRVVTLPSDWTQRCLFDDWGRVHYYAEKGKKYVKYTANDGKSYHLLYPLEQAFFFWKNSKDEYVQCIDTEQYNSGEYKDCAYVFPGNDDACITVVAGEKKYELPLKYGRQDLLSHAFNALVGVIALGADVKVCIGEQVLYDGKYFPNCCCIMDDKLYCHPLLQNGRLEMRHESYYYRADDYISLSSYQLNDMSWRENYLMDLPSIPASCKESIVQFLYTRNGRQYELLAEYGTTRPGIIWLDERDFRQDLASIEKGLERSMLPVRWFADRFKISVVEYDSVFSADLRVVKSFIKISRMAGASFERPRVNFAENIPSDILLTSHEIESLLEKILYNADLDVKLHVNELWKGLNHDFERKIFMLALLLCQEEHDSSILTDKEKCVIGVLYNYIRLTNWQDFQVYMSYVAGILPSPLKQCAKNVTIPFREIIEQVKKIDEVAAINLEEVATPNGLVPWGQLVNALEANWRPMERSVWVNIKNAIEDGGCSARSVVIAALYWYLLNRYACVDGISNSVRDICLHLFGENQLFYQQYQILVKRLDVISFR